MQSKYKLFVYDNIIDMLRMHLWIFVRQNSGNMANCAKKTFIFEVV